MVRASIEGDEAATSGQSMLSRDEIISNSFIFLFAGHETSANSIHFSILELAMSLPSQVRLQADIDRIVGADKPTSSFSYYTDMPRLYNSMVGAVLNEQLRLTPPIISLTKVAVGSQPVLIDGKECLIPDDTIIHLNVVGSARNPKQWPSNPSKLTTKDHDLDDFVPERWLPSSDPSSTVQANQAGDKHKNSCLPPSFEGPPSDSLFKPTKAAFLPFSDGARACPGRRFAQVEITAVLTALFQRYTAELDVREWASDEEIEEMGNMERKEVYDIAIAKARTVVGRFEPVQVTLQMRVGDRVPVRFVERGRERFGRLF